eukprot:994735-Amorphochlora_amoeboformis.AAC.1
MHLTSGAATITVRITITHATSYVQITGAATVTVKAGITRATSATITATITHATVNTIIR